MSKRILVLGMDHVIDKLTYFYQEMVGRHGINVTYITSDSSGISAQNANECHIISVGTWRLPFTILRTLVLERPTHVEVYLSRLVPVLVATILCAVLRIPITVVCRGTEILGWDTHRFPRRWVTRLVFRYASMVLWKELYMEKTILDNALCDEKKLYQIHNVVPRNLLSTDKFDRQSSSFVFLNSFKKFRNVDRLIKAFRMVVDRCQGARLIIVGSTANNENYSPASAEYEDGLFQLIDQLELADSIEVRPFSSDAWLNVESALAFALPADMIWLNFALLEAMAFGLPPILADVEGADRIIDDGISGLLTTTDPDQLAEVMIYALTHRREMALMSNAAREVVAQKFLVDHVVSQIVEQYKGRVWCSQELRQ